MTCLPILLAPVNTRWSKGWPVNACPTCGPPVMIATSSWAKTVGKIRASSADVWGLNSETLIMTRLPAARAPARPLKTMFTGKFQAVTIPTTPSG
ncbi:hypothetical protein D3C84_1075480 [compost metagenome]